MSAVTTMSPRAGPRRDPVVGRVELPARDDHQLDRAAFGHAHPRVRDQDHRDAVAGGDAVDLLLDRAGVGVDVDDPHGHGRSRLWRSSMVSPSL